MGLWIHSAEVRGVGGDIIRRMGTQQQLSVSPTKFALAMQIEDQVKYIDEVQC